MLTAHFDKIDEGNALKLKQLVSRCPELDAVADCVRAFARMMTERRGTELDAWLTRAEDTGLKPLRSLARGLRQDFDAVTAGLTLEWSSGKVEGNVNRVILWNQNCQACCALPWRTSRIGRRLAPAGTSSCRGVGPAGVGVSASLSRRRSSALWPSVTAACSSSVSGIETAIFCKLPLASRSWALVESLGV